MAIAPIRCQARVIRESRTTLLCQFRKVSSEGMQWVEGDQGREEKSFRVAETIVACAGQKEDNLGRPGRARQQQWTWS